MIPVLSTNTFPPPRKSNDTNSRMGPQQTPAHDPAATATTAKSPFFHPGTKHLHITSKKNGGNDDKVHAGVSSSSSLSFKDNTTTTNRNTDAITEHKSTLVGAVANLVNSIVGCGIVGIPYAMKLSGFTAGIVVLAITAIITEKSLRLLIATAKHIHTPTYETSFEGCFGTKGFYFATANMFIVAYGAMVSYLMVMKDTFSTVLGIDPSAPHTGHRRLVLFLISFGIVFPLSSQRDMADLSKTSRLNVVIDTCLVALVAYSSIQNILQTANDGTESYNLVPNDTSFKTTEFETSMALQHTTEFHSTTDNNAISIITNRLYELVTSNLIEYDTIFIGMGIFSFAFVCQHAAFVIAGSIPDPTCQRWSYVTKWSICICTVLSYVCGITGYMGYADTTAGNILNNLDPTSHLANTARLLLGITMIFVYPLECYIARHVAIVIFFSGREAHDGNDTSILYRTDRRIYLTFVVYVLTIIPALTFSNTGTVFAITGAIGGSCLSYIGPGLLYLGVHGAEFLSYIVPYHPSNYWKSSSTINQHQDPTSASTATVHNNNNTEQTPFLPKVSSNQTGEPSNVPPISSSATIISSTVLWLFHTIIWYVLGMPLWCAIAQAGVVGLENHARTLVVKSPHPLRIGDVECDFYHPNSSTENDDSSDDNTTTNENDNNNNNEKAQSVCKFKNQTSLPLSFDAKRSGSLKQYYSSTTTSNQFDPDENDNAVHNKDSLHSQLRTNQWLQRNTPQQQHDRNNVVSESKAATNNTTKLKNHHHHEHHHATIEPDPQHDPSKVSDFFVAIFLIIFGWIAMVAGLYSIYVS